MHLDVQETERAVRRRLTVLAVDDDPEDAELLAGDLARVAEWDVEFLHVTDGAAARNMLSERAVELVFLDYCLGAESGLEVLNLLRASGDLRAVIVLTGRGDEYAAASLTRAGADDYVVKSDLSPEVLRRAVGFALAKHKQRIAEHEVARQAVELARTTRNLAASNAALIRQAAELEAANLRLQELDQLKSKFLSEASHEIRTPLAAIVSAAKIIRKHHSSKPEVAEKFGLTIISEGQRLTRLINDFLDLAKIEAGCMQWSDSATAPEDLVREAVAGAQALAMEKRLALTGEARGPLPPIRVDHDRILQVLTNLLNNALKFTPALGHVQVEAALEGSAIRFSVSDSGGGIPSEEIDKIFDRFHQVRSPAGKTLPRGTGLGLCICREIVEHYGGHIWVESEIGAGTRFNFTVPTMANNAHSSRTISAP